MTSDQQQPIQVEDASSRRALGIIVGILLSAVLVVVIIAIASAQSKSDCAGDQAEYLLDNPDAATVASCD